MSPFHDQETKQGQCPELGTRPGNWYFYLKVASHKRSHVNADESRSSKRDQRMRERVIKFQRVRDVERILERREVGQGRSHVIVWKAERKTSRRSDGDAAGGARSVTCRLFIHRSMIFRVTGHTRTIKKDRERATLQGGESKTARSRIATERHWRPTVQESERDQTIATDSNCTSSRSTGGFSSWDTGCRFDLTER